MPRCHAVYQFWLWCNILIFAWVVSRHFKDPEIAFNLYGSLFHWVKALGWRKESFNAGILLATRVSLWDHLFHKGLIETTHHQESVCRQVKVLREPTKVLGTAVYPTIPTCASEPNQSEWWENAWPAAVQGLVGSTKLLDTCTATVLDRRLSVDVCRINWNV